MKILTASRVSDRLGPVVYSKYDTPNANGITDFDSQQDAYNKFVNDLTVAISDLQKYKILQQRRMWKIKVW
ncbi:SusD/RagB family nutrient-binding outer membrane lipoprotein [Chryseobacterium carnipullorum]|uniref:SusD/RagB family nutrient-binding outer membrane lipoprotein n=1 Tax=Chryseobacterium carnipullorum TaxID=1124835 RepID=UPI0021CF1F88|nr:SusD/RagB family nutrient-binding outer membrane lipoprotein [Chryseobacterium carnipullorum]